MRRSIALGELRGGARELEEERSLAVVLDAVEHDAAHVQVHPQRAVVAMGEVHGAALGSHEQAVLGACREAAQERLAVDAAHLALGLGFEGEEAGRSKGRGRTKRQIGSSGRT